MPLVRRAHPRSSPLVLDESRTSASSSSPRTPPTPCSPRASRPPRPRSRAPTSTAAARRRRQPRHPLVQRSSATRSGSGSTSAPPPRSARSCCSGRARTAGRSRSRPRPTAPPGPTSTRTTTGAGGTQTLNVTGTGRYVRMYGTARGTGYGYSLWEFKVYGTGGGRPRRRPAAGPTPATGPRSGPTTSTARPTPRRRAANWLLRTGTQYPGGAANWGTGSVETASDSTANVYLDGAGRLQHQGGPRRRRRLDVRPDRDPAHRLRPAAGRAAQVHRGAQAARRRQRPRLLAGLPGDRRGLPRQLHQLAGRRRDRHHDRRQRAQPARPRRCTAAPPRTASCAEYNGRTSGLATCTGCQTGYHEYTPGHRPHEDRRGDPLLPRRPADLGRAARARSASPPGRPPCTTASTCGSTSRSAARCPNAVAGLHHADRRRPPPAAC